MTDLTIPPPTKPTPESERRLPRSGKGSMPEHSLCIDCGFDTQPGALTRVQVDTLIAAGAEDLGVLNYDHNTETYYVRDHIWKAAGMEPFGGCLCIGCLEKRIGRRLKPKDFQRDHPFNTLPGSPRLLSRRGRQGGVPWRKGGES